MKKLSYLLLPPFLLADTALGAENQKPDKPNVILIISDDQGFADCGFMGHERIQTPNLDRLATGSLLSTRVNVMPVCSPTLACLLTGKTPRENVITEAGYPARWNAGKPGPQRSDGPVQTASLAGRIRPCWSPGC